MSDEQDARVAVALTCDWQAVYESWGPRGEWEIDLMPVYVGNVVLPEGETFELIADGMVRIGDELGARVTVVKWEVVDWLMLVRATADIPG